MTAPVDPLSEFLDAASVPMDAAHASGTLERAAELLAAHRDLPERDVHAAAVLGDADAVRRHLARDAGRATRAGGPRGWDPLTYLCFSRYLRLDPARSDGFVRAAEALLDAGADPNGGWLEPEHRPEPQRESVLYGAAGIAHHPELTRLLLARGADPNDVEVTYHAPESYDNRALKLLVESGRMTADSLAVMLLRKADWHDLEGIRWLLEHGADPNRLTVFRRTALHQAIVRDNALAIVDLLLDHGADPTIPLEGRALAAVAAGRGRGDVLRSLERRGVLPKLEGADELIAACAMDDEERVRTLAAADPALVAQVVADGGALLGRFAGNGNTAGVRHLLDLGVDVSAPFAEGDGYFGVAPNSTALHAAAWRAQHATVRLLIARHAPVNLVDSAGRTPLALAVRACVDSYWTDRRSPESVGALLRAGASPMGVRFPSGYADVDELLRAAL